jgi:transcriptional regulator with XRE-family HTH domain
MKRTSNPTGESEDGHALLRMLTTKAAQRGDTLASLAASLGVTYERLAQWRRGESSIARARRTVHERAARYLGIPTVLVLAMAGLINLEEFIWPSRASLRERIARDLAGC